MSYIAEPIGREELRKLSKEIRKITGINDELYFPVMNFAEIVMPLLFPSFQLEIAPVEDFPENKHAETDVSNHIISIREDIYIMVLLKAMVEIE